MSNTHSPQKKSLLSRTLANILLVLAAINLLLLALHLVVQLADVVGAGVDSFTSEDGTSCYLYRSSISCVPARAPSAKPLSLHRTNQTAPAWSHMG